VLDSDGICRRFPVRELTLEGPRYAFALEVARYLSPERTNEFLAQYGIGGNSVNPNIIKAPPILGPIAFRRDGFDTVSAADVLSARNLALLGGRPVLVGFGPTEIADRLTTPVSHQLPTPGVEIHAHILDAVLGGRTLRALPPLVSGALIALTCLAAVAVLRNQKGWKALALTICLAALSYLVGLAIFVLQYRIPPLGPMLLAVFFASVVVYGADFIAVERSVQRQMKGLRYWLVQHRRFPLAEVEDMAHNLDTLQELQNQLGSLFELHEKLLEASHDAIGVFDQRGTLLLQNSNFQRIFSSLPRFTTMDDLREGVAWSRDASVGPGEAEAHVAGQLFSVRQVALPPTAVSPAGGAIWMLSSLQAREERDHARAEVLGFMTHELRTPMTAIQGFAELMMEFPSSPQCVRAPEIIYRESKRLLALIHSYLDVLRLDAGAREPAMKPVGIAGMAREVFDLLDPIAAASQMTLTWIGEDTVVFADPALLKGAILNIVGNAIKYGEHGREISVATQVENDEVAITVHNFGRPIDVSDVPKLFSSYARGSSAAEQAPGWGLGLAFVERIAEKHGGRVSVESAGDGTTFMIHLPADERAAVAGGVR
jgi:signal transduction histidine kinase